ncbi:site-specific integrase [Leeia oryzae]|uniref:site-specific integrase n=1 Tax=Leeia oryzae TaxID=356662 RepID=UPI00035E8187|nr:site-specific integrase [Leeia oryzae]
MATINKRGDYQWQATIRRKGYPTQCKTFERKRDAEDWAKAVESQMRQGVFADTKAAEKITLGEALQRYAETVTPKKKSARNELNRIARLQRNDLCLRSFASLTTQDFEKYATHRLKSCGPDTVRLELALISNLYNVAKANWEMPIKNPIVRGLKPSPSPGRTRRLSNEEEKRLFETLEGLQDDSLKFCTQLAIETGMRVDEIASLTWQHVNLDERILFLPGSQTKNSESRVVPLSEAAERLIYTRKKSFATPPESNKRVSNYLTGNSLGKAFARACKKAEIIDFRFHDLRHEAASRYAPHMPASTLAKIMGWKTIQMAMRYYNPSNSELVDAVRRKSYTPNLAFAA